MKIWFNKINESRRSLFEVEDKDENDQPIDVEVTIGRDASNMLVLKARLFRGVTRWCADWAENLSWRMLG